MICLRTSKRQQMIVREESAGSAVEAPLWISREINIVTASGNQQQARIAGNVFRFVVDSGRDEIQLSQGFLRKPTHASPAELTRIDLHRLAAETGFVRPGCQQRCR